MKNTSILLILLILFSCGSARRGTKVLVTYRFNGQVFLDVPTDCIPNMNRTITLKSKLTLMKQDSTIITETITDSLGNFDTMVAIDTSWNPLLLKVKGLENHSIDSMSSAIYCSIHFLCTSHSMLVSSSIELSSNDRKNIDVRCFQLDITHPEH